MHSKSGRTYAVLSRGVPIRGRHGAVHSWIGIHLDVTAMESAAEERIRQARDIARFNAELEQLAYVSAHDLQEPLRMIASYLQLLERRYAEKLDSDAQTFIGYAVEGAARLQTLLHDLLILQQIGKRTRERSAVPLERVVQKALEKTARSAESAAITCGELPEILCDEHEFRLLFENLIDNGIKYARPGSRPEVQISAEPNPDGWLISVRDNGIGIHEEYLSRIFDVFQRLHSRGQYAGTGIGLAIAKKVVEVHGGRIWAESEPGKGTTVKFTIPA
jgi:light-regulated signal transduction histidine kinase (bacteriophytochrome)